MSRKTILIIIVLILLALGGWGIYSSQKNTASSTGGSTSKSFLGSLFPFGVGSTPNTSDTPDGTTPAPEDTTPTPSDSKHSLTRISTRLVGGETVLAPSTQPTIVMHDILDPTGAPTQIGTLPIIRFMERGTGYIYDIDAKGQNEKKLTQTVISRAEIAQFADSGKSVLVRYVKTDNQTVATFLGHIKTTLAGAVDMTGEFLPDNISDTVPSSDGKNFAYLMPAASGIVGMTMKADGTAKKQVFSSSFSEWLLDWSALGLSVTTKASADFPGFLYSVSSSGAFTKILGSVNGLTTKTSPDGKQVLYSIADTDGITLRIRHQDGSDTGTGLQTLPEKCVVTPNSLFAYCGASSEIPAGSYPDMWYQGKMHFTDGLWKIDLLTGATTQINSGEGNAIDATNLALDAKETFLFFTNKGDGSLWSLSLNK